KDSDPDERRNDQRQNHTKNSRTSARHKRTGPLLRDLDDDGRPVSENLGHALGYLCRVVTHRDDGVSPGVLGVLRHQSVGIAPGLLAELRPERDIASEEALESRAN